MNFWTVLQGVVNLLLLGAVGFYFFRLKKEERLRREDETRIQELSKLRKSLEQFLVEAAEISDTISQDIERKRSTAQEISNTLKKEKLELSGKLKELKSEVMRMQKQSDKKSDNNAGNKYSKAIQLAEMGLDPVEISRKSQIPLGEIELLLSLRR